MTVNIIAKRRGQGKTYDIVTWMMGDPEHRAIIVPHQRLVDYTKRMYLERGGPKEHAGNIINSSRAEFILRGSKVTEVGLDELHGIPEYYFNIPVKVATVTLGV